VLAMAAFLRIAMVASGAARGAMLASLMPWVPALAWSAGALLLAFFVTANLPYLAARTRNLRQQARSG